MNKFLNSNYSKIIYNNIDDIDAIAIALTITKLLSPQPTTIKAEAIP